MLSGLFHWSQLSTILDILSQENFILGCWVIFQCVHMPLDDYLSWFHNCLHEYCCTTHWSLGIFCIFWLCFFRICSQKWNSISYGRPLFSHFRICFSSQGLFSVITALICIHANKIINFPFPQIFIRKFFFVLLVLDILTGMKLYIILF